MQEEKGPMAGGLKESLIELSNRLAELREIHQGWALLIEVEAALGGKLYAPAPIFARIAAESDGAVGTATGYLLVLRRWLRELPDGIVGEESECGRLLADIFIEELAVLQNHQAIRIERCETPDGTELVGYLDTKPQPFVWRRKLAAGEDEARARR